MLTKQFANHSHPLSFPLFCKYERPCPNSDFKRRSSRPHTRPWRLPVPLPSTHQAPADKSSCRWHNETHSFQLCVKCDILFLCCVLTLLACVWGVDRTVHTAFLLLDTSHWGQHQSLASSSGQQSGFCTQHWHKGRGERGPPHSSFLKTHTVSCLSRQFKSHCKTWNSPANTVDVCSQTWCCCCFVLMAMKITKWFQRFTPFCEILTNELCYQARKSVVGGQRLW